MKLRPSSQVLILVNLLPIVGVLLLEWDVLSILILYWAENVIIGFVNVLKLTFCQCDNDLEGAVPAGQPVPRGGQGPPDIPAKGAKFFLIPFFVLHYGGFCYGHLSLLLAFFSGGPRPLSAASSMLNVWQTSLWIAAGAILCSHLFSFFTNYLGKGEYKRVGLHLLMFRPYGRIIVMQFTVVLGVVLLLLLRMPAAMLLFVIAAKIWTDLRAHEIERDKLSE